MSTHLEHNDCGEMKAGDADEDAQESERVCSRQE